MKKNDYFELLLRVPKTYLKTIDQVARRGFMSRTRLINNLIRDLCVKTANEKKTLAQGGGSCSANTQQNGSQPYSPPAPE